MKRGPKPIRRYMNELDDCPSCSTGVMLTRKGKYGPFLGCSNYPRCAYVAHLKIEKDLLEEQANALLLKNGYEV